MAGTLNAILGGVGLLVDATTGIANSASQVANAQTNRELAQQQMAIAQAQIRANEKLVEGWVMANDPGVRYKKAVEAGFDQQSAAMLAGRGAPRIVGMAALGPITVQEYNGLRGTQLAGRAASLVSPGRGPPSVGSRRHSTSSVWSDSTVDTWLSGASGTSGHWSVPSVGSLGTPGNPRPVRVIAGSTQATWTPSSTV